MTIDNCSLISLYQQLVKTCSPLVKHTRYYADSSTEATVAGLPKRIHNFAWIFVITMGGLLLLGTATLSHRSAGQLAVNASCVVARPVGQQLNRIKDQLLQLELRHQAGTLGEAGYARERQQIEETLRSLLKT